MKYRAYLSGGMEYIAGEGRQWREQLQRWLENDLGIDVFNPNAESDRILGQLCPGEDLRRMKQSDSERYRTIVSTLVDLDCREIAERSDLVLCLWDEGAMRGAGTKGELTMARYFGKPVFMVTSLPLQEIPGWVLGCTTRFFPSFDGLKTFLLSEFAGAAGRQGSK